MDSRAELEFAMKHGEFYKDAGSFNSIDAAKARACKIRKTSTGVNGGMCFRIYAGGGLVLVKQRNSGHRLRWSKGNGCSREEMAARDVEMMERVSRERKHLNDIMCGTNS